MYPYSVNEKVLYGSVGVCEIREITQKDFSGQTADYYVLVPVYSSQSTVYVPVNSATLCEKMRKMPPKDRINELFDCANGEPPEWDDNKYTRRDKFNDILEKGSDKDIFSLARALLDYSEKQIEKGKKLHVTDERVLAEAKKLIDEEVACVLDLPLKNISAYITEQVKAVREN